jgi:hypothetical protein
VDVLLLEIANRNAGSKSAEIPAWLAEGLTQQLIATDGATFFLPPPEAFENGVNVSRMIVDLTDGPPSARFHTRRLNPLAEAQALLRSRPPLTFNQLSWPGPEELTGSGGLAYRASAQLFVDQLLRMKDGPACLCAMLDQLSRHYNWQFALLAGFQIHFKSLLDVEKWWALQLVQYADRDLMQTFTAAESWKRLDEIVRSQIEVRSTAGELPLRTDVPLQKIVRELDLVSQTPVLSRKLQELNLFRPRVSQDLVQVVDDYRQVLTEYLQKRSGSGRLLPFGKAAGPVSDRLAEETIRKLDALDLRRAALRPASSAAPIAATGLP